MSQLSQRGDAKGVTGAECEEVIPLLAGGGASREKFPNLGVFSCGLGISHLYFKDTALPLI